ncbi:hypothetical protein VCX83_24605, partial [Aeromonas caviae]|uniref:hypothetical protein n=1 Tax=Aeromonas caviae TaxID=648 RepID=UPI002B2509F5
GQAIGPLPAGVAEGSCQVLHRENRLPVPGGVGAVNTVPVNGYISTAISPPDDFSPLRKALCEADSPTRMSMLRTALQLMAADPENQDWLTLEQLLDKLHHLPLASLDICQALIREPLALAMATLLLDNFSSRMAERLPSELPFEWLLMYRIFSYNQLK